MFSTPLSCVNTSRVRGVYALCPHMLVIQKLNVCVFASLRMTTYYRAVVMLSDHYCVSVCRKVPYDHVISPSSRRDG